MAKAIIISVKETPEELKKLKKNSPIHLQSRLKMLILMAGGLTNSVKLSAKTGVSRNSIASWKVDYKEGGIEQLISDNRGGDYLSGITDDQKKKIEKKLSDPKDAFQSFGQIQNWLKQELGIEKQYHALNKYLKRNFGAMLKVGRKSHVKKDEAAVTDFKKHTRIR